MFYSTISILALILNLIINRESFKNLNLISEDLSPEKQSAMLLCEIFDHSPVFRVGGDEFVIFLRGADFSNRTELMNTLHSRIKENQQSGQGPVLASGMAEYIPETDSLVSEILERADSKMYEDKQALKKEEK